MSTSARECRAKAESLTLIGRRTRMPSDGWLALRSSNSSSSPQQRSPVECLAPVDSRIGNLPRAPACNLPGVPTSQALWPSSHGQGGHGGEAGRRVARPQGPQDSRETRAALETDGAREINEEGSGSGCGMIVCRTGRAGGFGEQAACQRAAACCSVPARPSLSRERSGGVCGGGTTAFRSRTGANASVKHIAAPAVPRRAKAPAAPARRDGWGAVSAPPGPARPPLGPPRAE